MRPTTPTTTTDSPEAEITHHGAALGSDTLTDDDRRRILDDSDWSPFPQGAGKWGVMAEGGAITTDLGSEREAENWIIENARSPEKTPERGGAAG